MIVTLLILMNVVRTQPLIETAELDKVAQARAEYLCTHEFSHKNWASSFQNSDAVYIGENLTKGYNNDTERFVALIQSPTHRANILKPQYKKVGIGRACGYTVQLFSN